MQKIFSEVKEHGDTFPDRLQEWELPGERAGDEDPERFQNIGNKNL